MWERGERGEDGRPVTFKGWKRGARWIEHVGDDHLAIPKVPREGFKRPAVRNVAFLVPPDQR